MKLSDLKTMIKEVSSNPVLNKYLDERTKKEIDLIIEMGKELLKYQRGEYDNEGWDNPAAVFVDVLTTMHEESSIKGYEEAFKEFVENNMKNDLPNTSSGSFLNALTDIDGLLYSLGYEDAEDPDAYTQEQHDAAYSYFEKRRAELF